MWRQMPFAAASPFHHSRGQESGYVLAFEVELHSICGLDYSNPLILDGRMVIEANHVVKREISYSASLAGCILKFWSLQIFCGSPGTIQTGLSTYPYNIASLTQT